MPQQLGMAVFYTILGCLVVAVAGAIGFIYSGIYGVSALQPDNAIVRWVVDTTSDRSIGDCKHRTGQA